MICKGNSCHFPPGRFAWLGKECTIQHFPCHCRFQLDTLYIWSIPLHINQKVGKHNEMFKTQNVHITRYCAFKLKFSKFQVHYLADRGYPCHFLPGMWSDLVDRKCKNQHPLYHCRFLRGRVYIHRLCHPKRILLDKLKWTK